MAIVTLLTDFGRSDYYVAAVKGVLLGAAVAAGHEPPILVDLSHEVAAGDVEGAAFLLAAAAPAFPAGTVHLAVVDPGVGSSRRILAVAARGQLLVAPDNGLLTPWLDGARAIAVDRPDLYRPAPGHTFHGRDRFAPIAAALAAGEPLDALGPAIGDPVRLAARPPRRETGRLVGRVAHVDRFGNLITDLPAAWAPVDDFRVRLGAREVAVRRVDTYVELAPEEAGLLVGSLATLELSLDGASLAARWGVARGAAIELLHGNQKGLAARGMREGKRGRKARGALE